MQLKSDGGSSPLMQRILYEFGRSPAFETHIDRVRIVYRERRDAMVAAVRDAFPDAVLHVPEGGYYVWVTLPAHVDGDVLAAGAAAAGINLIAGSKFFSSAGNGSGNRVAPKNHVRLSYSYATPEQIQTGIARLARVYRAMAVR
jgi:2-aminoadipate transaminase